MWQHPALSPSCTFESIWAIKHLVVVVRLCCLLVLLALAGGGMAIAACTGCD